MPVYKQRSPFTKFLHGAFSQGLPQYVAHKREQKVDKQRQKDLDRRIKAGETRAKLDFYTAMTKNIDPRVRGRATAEIEKILGVAPYSVVAGRQRLQPTGYPQQRGMLQPGRMQMGPQRGGVMTQRQPALSEMISGAEPTRTKWEPASEAEYKRSKEYGVKPQLGKTPTWGQQQMVQGVRNDLMRGAGIVQSLAGEPNPYSIDSLEKAMDYISIKKLDPALYSKELKLYEPIIVRDKKGKLYHIPRRELEEAIKAGYEEVR